MESRKQRHIPLGCRFVPYDQWFLTHIEPTWKIKYIKQMILAKCFGLPFDPRKFIREDFGARASSPITFAPDDTARPISPIQFATAQEVRKKRSVGGLEDGDEVSSTSKPPAISTGSGPDDDGETLPGDEGYEEDDEWDEDDETSSPHLPYARPGGRVDVGGKIEALPASASIASPVGEKLSRKFNPLSKLTSSSNSSNHPSSNTNTTSQGSDFDAVQPQETNKKDEIQTHNYTLIRFSTGQVLEEDFLVSWYDLLSNELVELHASATPMSFDNTLDIPQSLMDPTYNPSATTQAHKSSRNRSRNESSTTTFISSGNTLTALPRHDPVAYAEPYWEGWVRALRSVYTSEMHNAMMGLGVGMPSFQDYGGGMMNMHNSMAGGLALFMADPALFPSTKYQSGIGGDELKKTLEWRDRWVVIRDGSINLCKSRYDLTPTHTMPLSTLAILRDATHLGVSQEKARLERHQRSHGSKSGESERHHRSHRRSLSQPRSTTSTVKDQRHRDDGRHSKAQPGSSRGTIDDPSRRTDKSSKHHAGYHTASAPAERGHRRTEDDPERQRQRAREKELARRERRYREEMELEYLRNWDNISFKRKKDKDKEKEKEKEKVDKGKGREIDPRYMGDTKGKGREYTSDGQQHIHISRRSEAAWETQHSENDERAKQERRKRYLELLVPHTREAAEAAGMKIICAKFKTARTSKHERDRDRDRNRQKKPGPDPGPPPSSHRYTSTGPSLAGESVVTIDPDLAERDRDRKDHSTLQTPIAELSNYQATQSQATSSLLQNVAPRKASLPVIHLSSNKPSLQSLSTLNSPAVSSMAASGSSAKFGIGGFFGKDRNAVGDREMPAEDPKREKEERKREEKERKAREKEQKVLEKKAKEKEKAKKKEETAEEEESLAGSGLGWKLGKKKSGKVKEDNPADPGPFSDSAVLSIQDNQPAISKAPREQQPLSIDTTLDSAKTPTAVVVVDGNEVQTSANMNTVQIEESTSKAKPLLTLSPIPDSAKHTKSGSNSSSCSLSSPVFHHSSDSDKSINDLDNDLHGYQTNTRRAERKGYRYGGYHDWKEPEQKPSVIGLFDPPEPHDSPEKGKEPKMIESPPRPPSQKSTEHSHWRDREREERQRKEDDHGEWIILDMGTDFAFNSILRIFHRYFTNPFASEFIPASMAAAAAPQNLLGVSQTSMPGHDSASMKTESILSHYASSTTLVREPDSASIMSEQHRHGSSLLTFSPDSAPPRELDVLSINTDTYKSQHPTNLHTSSKVSKTPPLVPALPYPEWRRELVLRARRHGMRDARRPLDLALHGWTRDFDEMDFSDMASKQEDRRSEMQSNTFGADLYGYDGQDHPDDDGDDVDHDWIHGADTTEGAGDEEAKEEEVQVAQPRSDEGRRMSQVSHVSTLKAAEMNAAAAASIRSSSQSVIEALDEKDERDQTPIDDEPWEDTESVGGYKDDEYEPSSGHGQDEQENANALDMDSVLSDSDEEAESETEWVAWIADLPRQVEVRKVEKELAIQRKVEEEEQKRQEALRKQGYGPGEKPLSPMIFSNPFSDQQQAPPLDVDYLDLERTDIVPQTQEQERRQHFARRRQLEPTIAMTTSTPSTPGTLTGSLERPLNSPHKSVISISSVIRPGVQSYTDGQQTHLTRLTSRTSTTLSSHSSSESLGHLTQTSLSVVPGHVLDDRDHDTVSSPTSPSYPSTGYISQSRQPTHSRSISGSDTGHRRLHHSISMPLGPGSVLNPVRGHGSSVPSSVPHSPTTPNKFIMKKPVQPVSMTILTPAQINEIESETNQRIQQQHSTGGFQPTAMASPSSSFIPKSSPIPMPRRSSSAGYSGPPGSPPPSAPAGTINLSSSLGSPGVAASALGGYGGSSSLSRSSSVLVKPYHPPSGISNERAERERGLLKKRPSDLGKGKEREVDVSPSMSKQRPKLSLATMSGGSSSPSSSVKTASSQPEVQSPTTSKMSSFLRRVRSGSSLHLDSHMEEEDDDAQPLSPTMSTREGREISPPPNRRKISTMDRFVRGLDSALEFVEGR